MTVVIPGNGHRTAMLALFPGSPTREQKLRATKSCSWAGPGNEATATLRTAFQAIVTVVAALFQELGGVYCHAIIAVCSTVSSVCDCHSRNMDINCHATCWHSAFVTVVTTLFQEMGTHCHATHCISACDYSNSKKWASSTTMPRAEFRENSFVTKG